jgi:hypothetical protein
MSQEPANTPPKSLWPFFLAGLVMIALFLLGAKALLSFSGPLPAEDAERAAERTEVYQALEEENKSKLSTYALLDDGRVQIPIAEAMRMAEARLNASEPAAAGPVNLLPPVMAPETVPAPDPAAAETTPAPAETPRPEAP